MMMSRLRDLQKKSRVIGDVRGMGLAIGLEIVADKATKTPAPKLTAEIVRGAYERGLLLIAPIGFYGNVIRIAPPLVIPEELAMKGCDIIEQAVLAAEPAATATLR